MPAEHCTPEHPDKTARKHVMVYEESCLEQGLNPARRLLHTSWICHSCGLVVWTHEQSFIHSGRS